jgi:hypothetical protein
MNKIRDRHRVADLRKIPHFAHLHQTILPISAIKLNAAQFQSRLNAAQLQSLTSKIAHKTRRVSTTHQQTANSLPRPASSLPSYRRRMAGLDHLFLSKRSLLNHFPTKLAALR